MIRKGISEVSWETVRRLVDSGERIVDIEKRFNGAITASQISYKKQLWKKEAYCKGDNKYSKYQTPEYRAWRKAVLIKDGFKCIVCKRGKPAVKVLQCDHIKSYSQHPELRYNVNNGRVLCVYHHKRTLNYGFKALKCNDEDNGDTWVKQEQILWKQQLIEKTIKKRLQKSLKKPISKR